METDIKKYWPYILGGLVGLYVLYKIMGSGSGGGSSPTPMTVPQTQITQQPQTDPLAQYRSDAFDQLAQFGLGAIQAQAAEAAAEAQAELSNTQLGDQYSLGTQQISAQEQEDYYNAQAAENQLANEYYNQQSAYASAANAASSYYNYLNNSALYNSISMGVGSILGGLGGSSSIYSTPGGIIF